MARRRTRASAIYSRDDAYKPGLLVPSGEEWAQDAVDVTWNRRLKTLTETARLARITDQRIDQWVKVSRERGATWEHIASVLGVTRQAAWSKYHDHSDASDQQTDRRLLVDALNMLRSHAVRAQAIGIRSTELVQEARKAGQSWDEIARELGVRRQTAWERYNGPITAADKSKG